MSDTTGIEWTDATWNPVRGCSRVSEGCRNCYAERVAARFSKPGQPYHGFAQVVAPRDLLDAVGGRRNGWTRKVALVPEHLADPLRWKRPRRIFVNSMSDLFHDALSNEEIAAVFGVMAAAPQHTFQVLTKRARRMREWFEWAGRLNLDELRAFAYRAVNGESDATRVSRGTTWPLPSVWIGVSVENQAAADERIPELLATPAAVRFLSCEPLLGPVDLTNTFADAACKRGGFWVIAGAESGPGARHIDASAFASLRDQCEAAGVPYFLKQAVHSPITYGTGDIRLHSLEDVTAGPGSKRKPGGLIGAPYLRGKDGVPRQHLEFPQ